MSNQHRNSGGRPFRNQRDSRPPIDVPAFEEAWIKEGITKKAVDYTEKLGEKLASMRFTTSQFRNFYGELKRIQLKGIAENISSFHLLKPKLAYAAKRAGKGGGEEFKKAIIKMSDAVAIDEEGYKKRFNNFCDMVEAILAFHKSFGGRD